MAEISSVKNTSFPVNGKWRGYNYSANNSVANDENMTFAAAMFYSGSAAIGHKYDISCKWEPLRDQILAQWPNLTRKEVDAAGPNLGYLTTLISSKYGLDYRMIKNYLTNLQRNLPLI